MKKVSSNLRVTEISTIANNLIRQYQWDTNISSDSFLEKTIDEMDELSGRLTIAIQRGTVKLGLDEADAVRDGVIRDLGTLIDGYTAIPFENQKDAAYAIKSIFDRYGKRIASEPFAVESSLIESMLVDFSTPVTLAAIKALPGVGELLAQLRLAQDKFNEASDKQTVANAVDKPPSATELKKDMLNLLNDLKERYRFTYLFITHDLSVVHYMADRIMVMQKGKIVESGTPDDIFANPQTDYTRTLIEAIPRIG